MQKQSFQFYNIVPFSPGSEEQTARDVLELYEQTGLDVALYALSFHPEGRPAFRKAEILLESYRKFARALAGTPVRTGILIQSILGHWPRVDREVEPWTRTVNCKGEVVRFCQLDPGFRQYIVDVVTAVAREKPCFLMTDDDMRTFSPEAECFCELHTAEFNRLNHTFFTPEEYRKAVCSCKIGDPVHQAFERLRQKTIYDTAHLIRSAIDAVDPSLECGACSAFSEFRIIGEIARQQAGTLPATLRVNNSMYLESSIRGLPDNLLYTQAMVLNYQDIPYRLDESDTFPHHLYSKSAVTMHLKLCSGIFAGLNGSKIWFVNCHKNGVPVSRKYTQILARHRNYYSVLCESVQKTLPAGVRIPVYQTNVHPACEISQSWLPSETWAKEEFGFYGIPFCPSFRREEGGIQALAGRSAVERLSDAEIRTLFRGRLLIDGAAAAALSERGFASDMGVSASMTPFRYNRETEAGGQGLPCRKDPSVPLLKLLPGGKSEVLASYRYVPFTGSPDPAEIVSPATVYHENASGGKVIVTGYNTRISIYRNSNVRKRHLTGLLDKLNGGPIPFTAAAEQPVTLVHRQGTDHDLLLFMNLGFDPLETLSLRTARPVASAEILTPEGVWKTLSFSMHGNVSEFPVSLPCCGEAVLRIRSR